MEQLLIFHATKKPWRKAHIALHAACGILSSPRALRPHVGTTCVEDGNHSWRRTCRSEDIRPCYRNPFRLIVKLS
jgi:hypothetical protein